MKGPENSLSSAENSGDLKVTRKIEVVPAEDFWNEQYWGDGSDGWTLEEAEAYAKEMSSKEEPLPYVPFEPKTELQNIRRLSPEEQKLTDEEKRKIRTERLVSFKENLARQKEGIARTVGILWDAVETEPDSTAETLLSKVQALAPEYRFSRDQMALFK